FHLGLLGDHGDGSLAFEIARIWDWAPERDGHVRDVARRDQATGTVEGGGVLEMHRFVWCLEHRDVKNPRQRHQRRREHDDREHGVCRAVPHQGAPAVMAGRRRCHADAYMAQSEPCGMTRLRSRSGLTPCREMTSTAVVAM